MACKLCMHESLAQDAQELDRDVAALPAPTMEALLRTRGYELPSAQDMEGEPMAMATPWGTTMAQTFHLTPKRRPCRLSRSLAGRLVVWMIVYVIVGLCVMSMMIFLYIYIYIYIYMYIY